MFQSAMTTLKGYVGSITHKDHMTIISIAVNYLTLTNQNRVDYYAINAHDPQIREFISQYLRKGDFIILEVQQTKGNNNITYYNLINSGNVIIQTKENMNELRNRANAYNQQNHINYHIG